MTSVALHPSVGTRPQRLAVEVERALAAGAVGHLGTLAARDQRDALLSLLAIYDLHTAPIDDLGGRERFQHHPGVASLKWQLEQHVVTTLDEAAADDLDGLPADPVAAVRALAARDLVPGVYDWLATEATWEDVVAFLNLEGGPDAGFDDLVAACQVGLAGEAKLELATNYWDEMGNGVAADVHTELHHRMAAALGLAAIPREFQPDAALLRAALGGMLATNRHLQPEMAGALGVVELQAGPRCRKVLAAFDRLGAPDEARRFYEVHAAVDPRHGKDWLDRVVAPLGAEPRWAAGMVRGAAWRVAVNRRFFDAVADRLWRERQSSDARSSDPPSSIELRASAGWGDAK